MELEARAQAAAAAAGAPVPHILVADDSPAALGNPFLICDEIKGETIVRRIQRQLDGADGHGAARALAPAMRAGAGRHPPGRRARSGPDPRGPARRVARAARRDGRHHRHLRMGVSLAGRPPAAAVADGSGARRLPDGKPHRRRIRPCRCSGLGAGARRQAYEDLAWFCIRAWRFGAPASLGAGGLGSIESFLLAYEQASGTTVDRVAFHWWLVLATLRWGVICRLPGGAALERASPARWSWRRSGAAYARPSGICSTCSRKGRSHDVRDPLHGRPTAAELVAAVAEFIEGDVREATTGQVNFHARVAANVLAHRRARTARRRATAEARAALTGLGFADEAALAAAIRAGELDGRAEDVTACLRTLVRHRLAVAHPGYDSE